MPPYFSNYFSETFPPVSQPLIPYKYSLPMRNTRATDILLSDTCSQGWELKGHEHSPVYEKARLWNENKVSKDPSLSNHCDPVYD